MKHLTAVYIKGCAIIADANHVEAARTFDDEARSLFQRLERGDAQLMAMWERFRALSVNAYRDTYQRIGIEFDVYDGEQRQSGPALALVDHLLS